MHEISRFPKNLALFILPQLGFTGKMRQSHFTLSIQSVSCLASLQTLEMDDLRKDLPKPTIWLPSEEVDGVCVCVCVRARARMQGRGQGGELGQGLYLQQFRNRQNT